MNTHFLNKKSEALSPEKRSMEIEFLGKKGTPFFWNPFSTGFLPGSNYNVCISGAPGSGKSVLMKEMISKVIGAGGKAFVLDMGRSFKKFCHFLGGQHIELNVTSPLNLNPFTGVPTGHDKRSVEEREEMLAIIRSIFQVMAASKQETSDLQDAYLEQAVRYSWEKYGNKSSVDTVKEFLDRHENKVANDLGQTLSPFCTSGSFDHFSNKAANTDFKEKLTVIETDHLRDYPSLTAVVVPMLILRIIQEMARGDRKTPFLIIIEHACHVLGRGVMEEFISKATRTARQYKGSFVFGAQHLTDYFKSESPGATEAFNCSAWKIVLYQGLYEVSTLSSYPQLKRYVDTKQKAEVLQSINSHPPHYSEMAIFGEGMDGIVGRLHIEAFSRFLYSTNEEDHCLIEEYTKQGASIEEAIELVMTMHPEAINQCGIR